MMPLVEHAAELKRQQSQQMISVSARVTLETREPQEASTLRAELQRELPGVRLELEALFEPEKGQQARFFSLTIPGVATASFDLAYDLIDSLSLASARPALDAEPGLPHAPVADIPQEKPADDEPSDPEWHLKNLRVFEAWEYSDAAGRGARGQGVLIGQVDTGIAEHALVRDIIDWKSGQHMFPPPNRPVDPLDYTGNPGHGLSVAATASSRGEGADKEIAGPAPLAMIAPFRAVNSVVIWFNNADYVARGIRAATESGAHVISLSLGGPDWWRDIRNAILSAIVDDILVIAAAGNWYGPFWGSCSRRASKRSSQSPARPRRAQPGPVPVVAGR